MVIDPQLADATHPAGKPRRCPTCYDPGADAALQQTLIEQNGLTTSERKCKIADLTIHRGNKPAVDAVSSIIKQYSGITYLWSFPVHGVGKTHLLATAVNNFNANGLQARYTSMFDLLDYLREGYDEESESNYHARKEQLLTLPLLCIDEMERFSGTVFAQEAVTAIISTRYRYRDERATLMAGNIPPSKLPPHLMDRLTPCAIEIVSTKSWRA